MANLPFKTNHLLDPKTVVQNQATVKDVRDQCLAHVQKIADRRGDICERLSPAHQDELRASIESVSALQKDVDKLRGERLGLQRTVDSINDDLTAFAGQEPEVCLAQCNGLGQESMATLLRINQLVFKGTEIPGLTPEQRERLRSEAKLLDRPDRRGSDMVMSTQNELEAERNVANKLRADLEGLRAAWDAKRAEVSDRDRRIMELEKTIGDLRRELVSKEKRKSDDREKIHRLDGMCDKLSEQLVDERGQRDEIVAENSRLQGRLEGVDEQHEELRQILDAVTTSKDTTNVEVTKWALEMEIETRKGLEAKLEKETEEWQAKLARQVEKMEQSDARHQQQAAQLNEQLAASRDEIPSLRGRMLAAEKHSRDARSTVLRLQTKVSQGKKREQDLAQDIRTARETHEQVEQRLASSKDHVQDLVEELGGLREQLQRRDEQSAHSETEYNTMINSNVGLKQSIRRYKEQKANMTQTMIEVRRDAEEAKSKAKQESDGLRQQVTSHQTLLDEAKTDKSNLEEQVRGLKGTTDMLGTQVSAQQEELGKTQEELQVKGQRVQELESVLDEQRAKVAGLLKNNADLSTRLTDAREEALASLVNLTGEKAKLQGRLDVAERSLSLEKDAHALTKDEARGDLTRLQDMVKTSGEGFQDRALQMTTDFTTSLEDKMVKLQITRDELASEKQTKGALQGQYENVLAERDGYQSKSQQLERRLQDANEDKVRYISRLEALFGRICTSSSHTDIPRLVQGLQGRYCRYSGPPVMRPNVCLLGSWGSQDISTACIAPQVDASVELLAFQLLESCGKKEVATASCQGLMLALLRALGSCVEVQPELLLELANTFDQSVSSCADVAFETGFAFWQIMTLVKKRWPLQFGQSHEKYWAWDVITSRLEIALCRTSYQKLFTLLKLNVSLPDQSPLPQRRWGNKLLICEPSWPRALLFDVELQTMRFFAKSRLTTQDGEDGFRITPVQGDDAVILSPWSVEASNWVVENFWGFG